jgi:dolichol-phosphate mannosyltransferase
MPRLFEKMGEGYDCVFGSRFCSGGAMHGSSSRYWLSYGGTLLTNLLLGTRLRDMTSGFELFTRDALQFVLARGIKSRGPFFQTEIKAYCRHLSIAEVPIHYRAGSHAMGKAAVTDALQNLWRLFRLRLAGEA